MIGLQEIEEARARVEEHVRRTPCSRSESFSERCGCTTYLKLETLQRTGSFKDRGATNKLLSLDEAERSRGVIAVSAGNHAQAVAFCARKLGIPTTIVMPETTPLIKVAHTRRLGAEVVLSGATLSGAEEEAERIRQERDLVSVHPYDDDAVIAGQGTMALELVEQAPDLELVVIPIGGGGLISGSAVALKHSKPQVRVVGVQTEVYPSMKRSLEAGRPLSLEPAQTIADGIAVKSPGDLTFEVAKRYVDDVVTVSEEEIANAILLLLEEEKAVVEGAGAVALAALYNGKISGSKGRQVVVILSGGNIDVHLISRIIERGLAKDGRLVRLAVKLGDRPGALARCLALVAEAQANVMQVHHDRVFSGSGLQEVGVEMTLETRGRDHVERLKAALVTDGYAVEELDAS